MTYFYYVLTFTFLLAVNAQDLEGFLPAGEGSGSGSSADETTTTTTTEVPTTTTPLHQGPDPCPYGLTEPNVLCLKNSESVVAIERPSPAEEILARHNYWREQSQLSPQAATPLVPLQWDAGLAMAAERWSAQCKAATSSGKDRALPDRGSDGQQFKLVGENLCLGSAGSSTSWTTCIDSWAGQRSNWQYGVGAINANEPTGGYTQIVSQTTTHVGCGKSLCKDVEWPEIMVCHYGPAGNVKQSTGEDGQLTPYVKQA